MKIKTKLASILLFIISTSAFAQVDYKYVRLQADVNNAFGIIDNPRTNPEVLGFDFDIEVGARDRSIGVYITYGRFDKQDYQNYAAGVDYYVNWLEDYNVSLSAGLNYGRVMRKITRCGTYDRQSVWSGSGAIALRTNATIKIYKGLGVTTTLQYQQRPELSKFIFEGAAGLEISF